MKKIIFVAQSLKVGGVERALVEQVNELAKEEDITLFLFSHTGAYITEIDEKVKVIYGNWILDCIGRTKKESAERLLTYIVRNGIALLVKMFGRELIYKILFLMYRKFSGYDVAISYVNDQGKHSLYSGCNQFVLSNVCAKRYVAWIHSDPRRLSLSEKSCISSYKKMDYVVNVSMAMKEEFDKLKVLPIEKSLCIYNRIDYDGIISKSKGPSPFKNHNTTIVTVGRLEELKGTKDLLQIAKRLVEIKADFTWYFIGEGVLRTFCESYILENRLSEYVVLLGNKENPYPYISNADIFVSGSQTETFGISIVEALLLNTPVIALKYSAINEIIDSSNGVVCLSYDEIYESLIRCMTNDDEVKRNVVRTSLLEDYNIRNNSQIMPILI